MRTYPTDTDHDEVTELRAAPWMLELLKLNPEYAFWGNFEDYMYKRDGQGWDSPLEYDSLAEMFELDELNEVVNFYFQVVRKGETCPVCEGEGYNEATRHLSRTWYTHRCPPGQTGWQHALTDVEVTALWEAGRLRGYPQQPTAEQLNQDYRKGFGHDAINQWICVKARASHQGVFGHCAACEGSGTHYLEDTAHVALQLWVLHPRKGASRGVYIRRLEEADVPKALALLNTAAERNAERFARAVAQFDALKTPV